LQEFAVQELFKSEHNGELPGQHTRSVEGVGGLTWISVALQVVNVEQPRCEVKVGATDSNSAGPQTDRLAQMRFDVLEPEET